ncbi:heat-shock protein 20 [Carboxydothermus islandicus]|uniref:Heat-shock protein 20 n=1 Tax=Carboxydothermus islandicus TaxID=661089 RepID=A0A1L8D4B0_9THEO|nr:Hsp20/alpha crystallin family protein [Carboxydothermus islandicus]GAV26009.1 heat-shock protein 20 [Carboxydothermus islandicus]
MLIPFDPWREMLNFKNQMERFFERGDFLEPFNPARLFSPRVEIFEEGNDVVVRAEIPGLNAKEDLEVIVEPESLTLRGEIRNERERKQERFYRSERYYGKFSRTIALPAEVEPDHARASYQNGILEVRMKKSGKNNPRARRIEIQ